MPRLRPTLLGALLLALPAAPAFADTTVGCVTTAWKLVGANHKVCVEAFHDPKVPDCEITQAEIRRTPM